eukprot:2397786-Pyramimonas_sp.AAC.1
MVNSPASVVNSPASGVNSPASGVNSPASVVTSEPSEDRGPNTEAGTSLEPTRTNDQTKPDSQCARYLGYPLGLLGTGVYKAITQTHHSRSVRFTLHEPKALASRKGGRERHRRVRRDARNVRAIVMELVEPSGGRGGRRGGEGAEGTLRRALAGLRQHAPQERGEGDEGLEHHLRPTSQADALCAGPPFDSPFTPPLRVAAMRHGSTGLH